MNAILKWMMDLQGFTFFLTLIAILWYTLETKRIREVEQQPVMMLYIRDIYELPIDKCEQQRQYVFKTNAGKLSEELRMGVGVLPPIDNLMFRLRNVGNGAAFNLEVTEESDCFRVSQYQSRFFAPRSDEQSILVESTSESPGSEDDINRMVFCVSCKSVNGRKYVYRYRVRDFEQQVVDFVP